MREFILNASKAVTKPFDINKLFLTGRIDIVCRCVINALFVSEATRNDTVFYAALEGPPLPPKLISFDSRFLSGLTIDEKDIAECLNKSLKLGRKLKLNESKEVSEGIKIEKKSLESLIKEKSEKTQLIHLHPKGEDIRNFSFKGNICFILGDSRGLPKNTEKFLDRLGAEKVSIGPLTYLASQTILLCHNELDRRGI